ncbi:MAG: hypothetical protein JWN17_1760 [Frankiales bacterium]|nr:hypothetical protein [Frankiales bacterium]
MTRDEDRASALDDGDDTSWPDDEDAGLDERDDAGQDPVQSMHDTQERSGDDAGLADLYVLDTREAEQSGVALDRAADQEALLD